MPEISVDGRMIAYRDQGSGPPVILLHCSSSHSGQWKPLISELQNEYRCLAPDLHGYGRSEQLADDRGSYCVQDANIVAHLVEMVGEAPHLIGHSLGGTVAIYYALSNPQRVRTLSAVEPVLFGLLEDVSDPDRVDIAPTPTMSRSITKRFIGI